MREHVFTARTAGAVLALCLAACQSSDTSGESGTLPDGWRADTFASWISDGTLHSPLKCNDIWDAEGEAVQRVESCESIDFKPLYDQALANAERIVAGIQCAEDCLDRKPQTQVSWYSFWCAANEAHAAVVLQLLCRRAATDTFPWQGTSPASYTPQPVPTGPSSRPHTPVQFTSTLVPNPVACGSASNVEYHYERRERDFPCSSFDFDGLRDTAQARARDMWNAYQCAPGCTKKPFQVLRERWNCAQSPDGDGNGRPDEARATVTVNFSVECTGQ